MDVSGTIISKFILVTGLFAACAVNAQTTTTGMVLVGTPSGLSYYDAGTAASGTTQATTPTIFGGLTGSTETCASPTDQTATCNSCAGTGLVPCNQSSVHANLLLQVTLKSSTAGTFQNSPKLRWKFSNETGTHAVDNSSAPSLVAGQAFTAQIKWTNLCFNAGAGIDCKTAIASKTLNIGIDNNNDDSFEEKYDFTFVVRYVDPSTQATLTACPVGTPPAYADQGICDYTVSRGDEKVYIADYAASSNDLQTSNASVKFNRIIMFYNVDATDAQTVTNASTYIIFNLTGNAPNEPSISDQRITGLANGKKYCFALGNMDQTGNISYFPPVSVLSNQTKVCATPSEVVGLLDDKRCFIATATFGSDMASEVQTFRKFRNEFLLTNFVGKLFVRAYYKIGPEAAEWISHSEFLRTLSLWALWPLLLFVKLSLALGLLPASLIALASVIMLKKSSSLLWQRRSILKGDA